MFSVILDDIYFYNGQNLSLMSRLLQFSPRKSNNRNVVGYLEPYNQLKVISGASEPYEW